jgi:hypothetical protein
VAAQLATSQEGLSSVSKQVLPRILVFFFFEYPGVGDAWLPSPAPCGAYGFRLERIGVVASKEMAQNNSCQGQRREGKARESSSVTCLS